MIVSTGGLEVPKEAHGDDGDDDGVDDDDDDDGDDDGVDDDDDDDGDDDGVDDDDDDDDDGDDDDVDDDDDDGDDDGVDDDDDDGDDDLPAGWSSGFVCFGKTSENKIYLKISLFNNSLCSSLRLIFNPVCMIIDG